uniref:Nuclear pore complex protein Nup153 n=1 Tax=Maylandia zebra TaxID=106582 RepID=A0A3P9B718_9CICH
MAATGGGKIRSRRYHIAAKPYAKSKQQSGLISRVTDTVKSIVPSWLQKYFKNGDAPEGGVDIHGTEQNCKPPPPPNGSEEGPPPLDGRDSPEPSTSNTEPSTSRASLNFQEYVLSRPPLSRSHLHFTPLDASSPTLGASSSLFSQPSTSSAPGPFSTGFSLVKEIKDNLSQHEDDNISTTSGFSSRASDKDVPTSKTASLPQLWSPETDRTNSGPQPSQSSLKKPAFNLSVFGTSSNSTLNSTVLNSSQLGDSPFYPGKTTYGGAAAVRSLRSRPGTPYQAPVRRQIKAKPAGAQPCGVTSATARRILQSLERMSSPLADAKRIPAAASSPLLSPVRMDSNLPPVQKLVVPAASVSGNRSVSFRPTLTPGGVTRAVDRTARDTHTRQSPQLPEATPGPSQSGPVYPLSSTPAVSSVSSGGGKMKRGKTSARPSSKRLEDEVAEVPELPAILLPISTSALPTFSFSSPLPPLNTSTSSSPKIPAVTPVKETVPDKVPSTPLFTFSSPIVKTTAASPPSFSPSVSIFSTFLIITQPCFRSFWSHVFMFTVKAAVKKSTEDFEGPFKPAKTLKQGSVLDLLKAPGFASPVAQISPARDATPQQTSTQSTAPASTSATSSISSTGFGGLFKPSADWTCDVCLVPNKQSDTKCVCCAAPQPKSSSKSMDSFGTMFSKPAGTWDCDTCLVINKPDAVKCVACETAKPGTGLKPSLTLSSAFSPVKTVSTPAAAVSTEFTGFGDKFKKPEGAWECDTCMVQNKAEDTKCVACTSAKPGASAGASSSTSSAPVLGLAEKFKKPEGAWECDVCLVQNKASDVQCVACQAGKPGAKVEPKAFGSTFGSSASGTSGSSASSTGGFKFGTSDSTSASGAGGFKFGGSLTESTSSSSSGGFKFGVPFGSSSSETTSKGTTATSGFKFGSSSESFKFGAASSDDKKSDQPAAGSGFKFGASGGIAFGTGSSSTEGNSSKGGFTIGLSKPEEKTTVTSTTSSSSITFTPPSSQENSNSKTSLSDTAYTDTGSGSISAATAGSVFGKLGEPSLATSAPQVVPTFGSSQAAKEPAAPTFTFGKPEEKKEAVTSSAPSTFLFAAASKDADTTQAFTGGFSFSKPNAPTEQPPPAFTFGKSTDKNETSSSEAPKPTFAFGKSAAEPASAAPKPAFSFLASKPTNVTNSTTSSSSTPTPSLFGAASGSSSSSTSTSAPAPSAAPNTFMFGQPAAASSDAPPAKNFIFGQSQDSQPPAPSAAPLNSTSAPAPAQPFIFGSPTNAAAAAAPAPAPASPSAGPTPFVFSSAPSAGFGNNQTPSFGSSFGSPFPATPSQTPAFGAKPNPPPAFGQQSNPTPVFGQGANPAPGGGFQFGGTSAFGATTNNTSGVFTFGAGSSASPAPPANPSIAPQSGAPGGGFNFGQTPTFNIGSTKSFTATSGGQPAIAGRKIKTAVRRRK